MICRLGTACKQTRTGLAVLCLLAAPATAADRPTFGETTEVLAVEVPVQVVIDGKPVRSLTQENFEVFDGRNKQEVTGFEVLDLQSGVALAEVSVASRRHFLFLFDLSFSDPEPLIRARHAAREIVHGRLHASDLVAVATYTNNKGPELILGFTADRRQAEVAIDTLGNPELLDRTPDPLRLVLADLVNEDRSVPPPAGGLGAGGGREIADQVMRENLEQMAVASERAERGSQAARVTSLTKSFTDLARTMASVRGRKYVVYLSQGFDNRLLVGNEEGDSEETRASLEAGEIWNVDSEARFGSSKSLNALERMLEEFRRADCVIQSVDISGLRAAGDVRSRPSGEAALMAMARDTGGEMYKNFNNLGEAMSQMLDRTSVTYVLTFQPDVKSDGTFHRLEVKLKNGPRGARLVHRPGYYAPRPFAQRAGLERQLLAADRLFDESDSGNLDATVLVAPFRAPSAGKAYVPVLIEVAAPSLFEGASGNTLAAEIYVYAFDAQGSVSDLLVQTIGLDLTKTPPALRQVGLKFFGHLDLGPGVHTVRAFVRNGQTGASAVRVQRVDVPGENAAARLLAPLFPEPFGRWMVVREQVPANEPAAAYPFMLGEAPYVPAVRPRLSPASGQVVLVGYNLAAASDFALDFHSMEGKSVARVPLAGVARLKTEAGLDRLTAQVEAKGVAPGFYTVQLVSAAGSEKPLMSEPLLVEVVAR